jgi:carboxypeptidase family protein
VRQHASLSRFQALVGVLAGVISISGAVFSYWRPLGPSPPATGEVVALVQAAPSARPLTGATIEVLAPKDLAIVTTLLTQNGRAQQTLKEGRYRLRVTYPRFDPQVRQVLVLAGQTAQVRIGLTPHPDPRPPAGDSTKNPFTDTIKRLFQ